MNVGILADTHDNLPAIRYLAAYFRQQDVESVIHAGDFVSPFTIPELVRFPGPVHGVFGNNDGDRETLLSKARDTTVEIERPPHRFRLGGREFLLSHRPEDVPEEIPPEVDVVIHGHTHERTVETGPNGHLRVNPGEAGGWLTGALHAVVLDTDTLDWVPHVCPRP